jgi:thioesterase domain-containing protein
MSRGGAGGEEPAAVEDPAIAEDPAAERPGLAVLRESGRPHLHLFHPGGGGTFAYHALVAGLPGQWSVTASDDAGTGDSVGELVDIYLRDLRRAGPVPDILGGWSLGGLLALEAGRRLADDGCERVPALVLIDTPLPGSAGEMPDPPRLNLEFIGMLWTNLRLNRCYVVELDAGDDVDLAARLVRVAVEGAGEEIEVGLLRRQLDVFRRHRRALVSYAGPATLTAPALTVATASEPDVTGEWSRWLSAPTIVRLPAGHYDLLRPPRVGHVAQLIAAWWSRVDPG